MKKDLGLYVHIPFCLKKCDYCDFLSFPSTDAAMSLYKDALIKEIKGASNLCKDASLSTVYIGGGTPTVLGDGLLSVIDEINKSFNLDKDIEFTVEANPESVSLGLMRHLNGLNVNRISLGVQAMNDEMLKSIGRVHTVKKVLESYAAIKIAGFENINYDLIFALPGQSEKDFEKGLVDLLKLEPKHLSLYSLQLEKGTPLYLKKDSLCFADEDTERKMYYSAREILKQHGLYQYEISNFAKDGHLSRHNQRYWDCKEYLGLGLGASSYFNNVRYENPSDMKKYIDFCNKFRPLYKKGIPLTNEEMQSEFVILGLRKTEGIRISEFEEKFGASIKQSFGDSIEKNLKYNLIEQSGDFIRLTQRGMDISNTVMCDFL